MVTAFKKVKGVSDVVVDFDEKTAKVIYDSTQATEQQLVDALKGTRFSASVRPVTK